MRASVGKLALIPAVVSENVTNKSCLVHDKSEKYSSWVTLQPQSDRCRQCEAEVRILDFRTTWSEFQKPYQTTAVGGEAKLRIHNLNPIPTEGGPFGPEQPKTVWHFLSFMSGVIKIHDFVSFSI